MSYYEFSLLLYDDLGRYIWILVGTLLLYYFLFRKIVYSVLDPFFLCLLFSASGFSVVIFLYFNANISSFYFAQYLMTQALFYGGFFLFASKTSYRLLPISTNNQEVLLKLGNRYYSFFIVISCLYIISQLYVYHVVGIPLFLESRLAAVGVGGGFGIINRLLSIFSLVVFYFAFVFVYTSNKKTAWLVVFFVAIFTILSGSKSAIIGIFMQLYLVYIINKDAFRNKLYKYNSKALLIFTIGTVGAILVLLMSSDSIEQAFERLFFRIVSSGDIYYMAYYNDNIEKLVTTDWWIVLTGDLFRTLRVIPEEQALSGLGFELFDLVNGTTGSLFGPNPRINVFSYVHFRLIGSCIYSLAFGMLFGYLRKKFYMNEHTSQYRRLILFMLYSAAVKIETDPPAFVASINNILLILTFFLFIENAFFRISRKCINSNYV